jgi:3-hydroxyacyl-[acyl-carrier-protein] dehydratase
MRFTLLDRIIEVQPGKRITAVKTLALSEEYLGDHFPLYPVMPGVLMLEAMTQCSAWLIRVSENFAHSMVVLKEARTVRYADFVAPGERLVVTAEVLGPIDRDTKFKVEGMVAESIKVSARMTLTRYNLAESNPNAAETDAWVVRQMRQLYQQLVRTPYVEVAGACDGMPSPITLITK